MGEKPDYLRQSAEPRTKHEKRGWFNNCADEAKRAGCRLIRASVHPDIPNLTLVEGWVNPRADQGDVNWQFEASKEKGDA